MQLSRHWGAFLTAVAVAMSALSGARADIAAQGLPTDTPAAVDLSGAVPAAQQFGPTETPTRTPTPPGPVQLEAVQIANVRANPDLEAALVGEIRPGEFYNVIRRYYRWIEFQYDPAPTRRGWVFDELVRIIGDESSVPSVTSLDEQVEGMPDVDATSTALAITATPGGLLTATAQARAQTTQEPGQIGFVTPESGNNLIPMTAEPLSGAPLPTFTYPPGILPMAPTAATAEVEAAPTDVAPRPASSGTVIPPILPIVALAGLGMLGLLVSAFRR